LEAASGKSSESVEHIGNDLTASRTQLAALAKENESLKADLAAAKEKPAVAAAPATAATPESAKKAAEDARAALAAMITKKEAAVSVDGTRVIVSLLTDELMQPATVQLSDSGLKALKALAPVIKDSGATRIRIVGHSDSTPVGKLPYPDNWELAAARACAVTRWFTGNPGIDAARFEAVSRAFVAPVGSNENAAGRRENRRVEIILEFATSP
jgi:chemotaxis protein MotB